MIQKKLPSSARPGSRTILAHVLLGAPGQASAENYDVDEMITE